MARFYFTYGESAAFPFVGGWTLVEADNMMQAMAAYAVYHPTPEGAFAPYAGVYNEDEFWKTKMPKTGNRGKYCHEVITIKRELWNHGTDT